MISRRLAWAMIFSRRSAPPPPLMRLSADREDGCAAVAQSHDHTGGHELDGVFGGLLFEMFGDVHVNCAFLL
jgi:hypothetical protein